MLLGEAPPELPPLVASEVESETVWLVAKEQSKYWKSINIKSCEPKEGLYPSVYVLFPEGHVDFPDFEEFAFAIPGAIFAKMFLIFFLLKVSVELLKAHRQDYMYKEFDMLEVPLMHDDVRERFSAQIMCS
jgi:histone deacetylase 6